MKDDNSLKFWQPNDATINLNLKGLIGTKMTVLRNDGTRYMGVVGGIDPYIGVSIVREQNKKLVAACLHGPFDPQVREIYLRSESFQLQYHEKFLVFVGMIKEAKKTGKFSLIELAARLEDINGSKIYGNNQSCPFGV